MSYAIIRTGGKQFRVEPGKKYRIPTIVGEAGGSIEFNDVLLGSDGNNVKTGVPTLSGAKVTGEIVKHGLGDKIVGLGTVYTIYALIDGVVKFEHKSKTRQKVSVYPAEATSAA
jgi:large subunit ribosomal protein L21